jgi:hypothetical protein
MFVTDDGVLVELVVARGSGVDVVTDGAVAVAPGMSCADDVAVLGVCSGAGGFWAVLAG